MYLNTKAIQNIIKLQVNGMIIETQNKHHETNKEKRKSGNNTKKHNNHLNFTKTKIMTT